jgi:protein TonB
MKQKKDIENITMSFVCPQNWDNMTICGNGRFCAVCQKMVYDFTNKSQAEYDAIVQKNEGQVCGRFTRKQVTPPAVNFAKAAAFAAFSFITTGVEAQKVKTQPTSVVVVPQVLMGKPVVDKIQPQFIGGQTAMYEFLKTHIRYKKAMLAQGIVEVNFMVETDGQLTHIEVSKSLHPAYDEEAVRLVKLMSGKWKPGSAFGKPYLFGQTIQIKFPLE